MPTMLYMFPYGGNTFEEKHTSSTSNKLGHIRVSVILCFHAQTGSDMSGRFARITNGWRFKVLMACDDDILNALESLLVLVLQPRR